MQPMWWMKAEQSLVHCKQKDTEVITKSLVALLTIDQ